MKSTIEVLTEKRKVMREYLLVKMNEEDWHGVMDAAADLREIDVYLKCAKLYNYAEDK
jgi:hypothetical protein